MRFNPSSLSMIKKIMQVIFYVGLVRGLDDDSIFATCQLTGYDVAYRVGKMYYKPVDEIQPDSATIENIRTMVNRSLSLFHTITLISFCYSHVID